MPVRQRLHRFSVAEEFPPPLNDNRPLFFGKFRSRILERLQL
jgi:hypothetical protein